MHAFGGGEGVRFCRFGQFRKAEVEHLHQPLLGNHEIRRFQIAVHDAVGVRGGDGVRDLYRVFQCIAQLQALAADQPVQGFALHEFHRDEIDAVVFGSIAADIVNRDDIGVI